MGNILNFFNAGYDDDENAANFNDRPLGPAIPSSTSNSNIQMESMVRSVKDVLPQVPVSVIRKDLSITSNVEETITRLVDGTIQYTPEQPENKSPSSQASSVKSSTFNVSSLPTSTACNPESLPNLSTAASTFGKSADERHKSFEERKRQLIESARLRYMMKHNMLSIAN